LTESTASLSDDDESQLDEAHEEGLLETRMSTTQDDKAEDPFMYYSSDKRRLESLLGRDLPQMAPEAITVRKTRISFELDPLFELINSYPDVFD